jgi:undecaprenyl-diphosphatase
LPNIDILILGIVQGVTEFLPISSSGHLILVPQLFCWKDQGLTMDVAAHVGTLLAVLVYFWRDVSGMFQGFVKVIQRKRDPRTKLLGLLLVGSLPALAVGFVLDQWVGEELRSPLVIGLSLIGFGALLLAADQMGVTVRRIEHLSFGHALAIGFFQCLAFIPGTSRSGITMTMARFLGYERPDAARFSFLLSIPTIAAAGIYKGWQLVSGGNLTALNSVLLMMAVSAGAGFLAIAFLMHWLRRAGFGPFVLYRFVVGAIVLYFALAEGGFGC